MRLETSFDIKAIVVGKIGPKQKPVRNKPTAETAGSGTNQTSSKPATTPSRQS